MDFENRPYRPLEMQRYHHAVNANHLAWVMVVGMLFFGLTCIGEPLECKTKNGKPPIVPAMTATQQAAP